MKEDTTLLKMSDEVIGQLYTMLQMAMLSGTDIVDHFRMMRMVEKNNELFLDKSYVKHFKDSIDKMMKEIQVQDKSTGKE